MNKEQHNSDTNNDYDEESFDDNETSEELSSNGESNSDESSVEELLDDNDKNFSNSIDKHQTDDESASENASSTRSEQSGKTNDVTLNPEKQSNSSLNILPEIAKTDADLNEHEIDESDAEDLVVDELSENTKLLTINSSKNHPDIEVQNLENSIDAEDEVKYSEEIQTSSCHCQQPEIEFEVTSRTPTSFNSENYTFHMDITKKPTHSNTSIHHQQRNSHRKSLSFSNERMREIERHNQILLRKILTQKPRKEFINQKSQSSSLRMTTSAVNRRKQQRQIDLDNQILKRKIETIALRRPKIT